MKVVVLGGTRFIGRRVADMLVDSGVDVTLFHRGSTGEGVVGTESVHGDRASAEDMRRLAGLRPHAVIDLSSYAAEWTRLAVEAFAGRLGQYIYVSSGAVYAPRAELPWPETSPIGPDPYWGTYAREKVQSERYLWDAQAHGRLAVT